MSQITSYSWDEENRLLGVVNPDSSTETYTYSGDGQRRSKSTLSDLIQYVWDGENVLQEVNGSTNQTIAHYTDNPGYWGGLASLRTSTGSFYYHFDQQSSTRHLTDGNADVSDEYTYRAFGEEVENTGTTRNPHRFQGEVGPCTEAEDRVWMRARQYDPSGGQWYSKDPIGFSGRDWNLYRFVRNNPINAIDPFGLEEGLYVEVPDIISVDVGWGLGVHIARDRYANWYIGPAFGVIIGASIQEGFIRGNNSQQSLFDHSTGTGATFGAAIGGAAGINYAAGDGSMSVSVGVGATGFSAYGTHSWNLTGPGRGPSGGRSMIATGDSRVVTTSRPAKTRDKSAPVKPGPVCTYDNTRTYYQGLAGQPGRQVMTKRTVVDVYDPKTGKYIRRYY